MKAKEIVQQLRDLIDVVDRESLEETKRRLRYLASAIEFEADDEE